MPDSHATGLRTGYLPPPKPAEAATVGRTVQRRTVRQWQANLTSVIGAALCIAAGAVLAAGGPILIAAILFPLGALCDLVDGMLARAVPRQESPEVGVFVDSICDKLGELALWTGLVVAFHQDSLTVLLIMLAFSAGLATSLLKAFAEVSRFDLRWDEARVFGRAGRAILLSVTLLLAALWSDQAGALLVVIGVLLAFNLSSMAWRVTLIARVAARQRQID